MKRIASLISVALILAMAAVASADMTVWSGAKYDVVITTPVAVGANPAGESLFGFMLKIVNTTVEAGLNPAGFNGCTPLETKPTDPTAWPTLPTHTGFTSGPASVGASPEFEVTVAGPDTFHNQYVATDATSPTLDKPAFSTDVDTHFNFETLQVVPRGTPPSEDNNPVAYPLSLTTNEPSNVDPLDPFAFLAANDFGNRLFGHFAVDGGAAADVDGDGDPTVWELAYFAVPLYTEVHMDFFVTGTDPGEVVDGFFVVVPEPATMSLLALGGVAALIRRRK